MPLGPIKDGSKNETGVTRAEAFLSPENRFLASTFSAARVMYMEFLLR